MGLVFLMDSSLSRLVAKAAILVLNRVRHRDACGHGDLAFNEILLGPSADFILSKIAISSTNHHCPSADPLSFACRVMLVLSNSMLANGHESIWLNMTGPSL